MLKAGGMEAAELLHRVIELAWAKGEVAEDWQKAVIVPIHKKGSTMMCSNYSGISLVSVPSKVFTQILDSRVRSKTEVIKVMEVQGGFRQGRSCLDEIFAIRQLSEKVVEKNKQMVIACIDLEKGYDTECRDRL